MRATATSPPCVRLVADEVVVDLAGAEHEPRDRRLVGGCVVDHGLEPAAGEVAERRRGLLQAQQALRRHDDERPGGRVERLPAQQVEVLRGGRAVGDPDVLLRRELQEALQPRARVLGPVALVAVREQQRQPRRLPPLRERGGDELVDHDLRAVREVAVLGLPEDERLRRSRGVAVLEAHARVLGERRVEDLEGCARVVEVLHRRERLAGVHVVEHEVPLRERPPLRVLAAQPNGDPVDEQRGIRERLRLAPVDAALLDRQHAAARAAVRASGGR